MSEWMDSLVDEKLTDGWTSGWIARPIVFFGKRIAGSNTLDGWMADCMDGWLIRRKLFG